MDARFEAHDPKKIKFIITASATLEDWLLILEAISSGKRGYYGPEQEMVELIKSMVSQAENVYFPKEQNK